MIYFDKSSYLKYNVPTIKHINIHMYNITRTNLTENVNKLFKFSLTLKYKIINIGKQHNFIEILKNGNDYNLQV